MTKNLQACSHYCIDRHIFKAIARDLSREKSLQMYYPVESSKNVREKKLRGNQRMIKRLKEVKKRLLCRLRNLLCRPSIDGPVRFDLGPVIE